jgi:hypothetical protein
VELGGTHGVTQMERNRQQRAEERRQHEESADDHRVEGARQPERAGGLRADEER